MNKPAIFPSYAFAAASLLSALAAQGQVLFQDNFDTTPASTWTVVGRGSGDVATIGFDYSTLGIPAAPNSAGTTVGAILYANQPGNPQPANPATTGVSILPTGQSFTGDYQLRYDVWQNYPGPYPAGGQGSTHLTGAGLNASGNTAVFAGGGDAVWFGATGDGGSTQDYRVYFNTAHQTASGFYAAGGQNSTNALYTSNFGDVDTGNGSTAPGSLGMEWHQVEITKLGNTITWSIDGITIATADVSGQTFGGSNIVFVQSDINATQTTEALESQLFGLIDNVVVTVVPEPSTFALLSLGGAFLFAVRRRKNS